VLGKSTVLPLEEDQDFYFFKDQDFKDHLNHLDIGGGGGKERK
jgi:hypothetical protein